MIYNNTAIKQENNTESQLSKEALDAIQLILLGYAQELKESSCNPPKKALYSETKEKGGEQG